MVSKKKPHISLLTVVCLTPEFLGYNLWLMIVEILIGDVFLAGVQIQLQDWGLEMLVQGLPDAQFCLAVDMASSRPETTVSTDSVGRVNESYKKPLL